VIDGGRALKKALQDIWGDRVLIQRCWIHKLRSLKSYAPEKYHGQIGWLLPSSNTVPNSESSKGISKSICSSLLWLKRKLK
jgi:putative transposase